MRLPSAECCDRGVPIAMFALGLSGPGEFGAVLCSQSPPHLATQWHVGRPALPVTVRTGTSASPRIRTLARVLSDNGRGCFRVVFVFNGSLIWASKQAAEWPARRCFDHRGPAGTLAVDWAGSGSVLGSSTTSSYGVRIRLLRVLTMRLLCVFLAGLLRARATVPSQFAQVTCGACGACVHLRPRVDDCRT